MVDQYLKQNFYNYYIQDIYYHNIDSICIYINFNAIIFHILPV